MRIRCRMVFLQDAEAIVLPAEHSEDEWSNRKVS
jgi:hypothetical protein